MLEEPAILAANCFFFRPNSSASGRRWNEKRHLNSVAEYLTQLGFTIKVGTESVEATLETDKVIFVKFSYQESCQNVYKHLFVSVDGKKSNISAIRKIAALREKQREGREVNA